MGNGTSKCNPCGAKDNFLSPPSSPSLQPASARSSLNSEWSTPGGLQRRTSSGNVSLAAPRAPSLLSAIGSDVDGLSLTGLDLYERCLNVAGRQSVYEATREWDTDEEILQDVRDLADRHLAKAQKNNQRPMFIVGEWHRSISAAKVVLALLARLRERFGPAVRLLLEDTPEQVEKVSASIVSTFDEMIAEHGLEEFERWLDMALRDEDAKTQRQLHTGLLVYFAHRAGIAIDGFDIRRPLEGESALCQAREDGMVRRLKESRAAGHEPIVVVTAAHHLPALFDGLRDDAGHHVVGLACIASPLAIEAEPDNSRESALHAHPDFWRFKSDGNTESRKFAFYGLMEKA
jgi:hypothetical protein